MLHPHEIIYRGNLGSTGEFNSQFFADALVEGTITEIYFRAKDVSNFTDSWYIGLKVEGVDVLVGGDRLHPVAADVRVPKVGLSIPVNLGDRMVPTVDERGLGTINGPISVIIVVDDGLAGTNQIGSGEAVVKATPAGPTVEIGDVAGTGNGTLITVDDSTGDVFFDGDGDVDFSGMGAMRIPNSATPTVDSNGELALDTAITDLDYGLLRYFAGVECFVLAVPVAMLAVLTDTYVVAYNAANNRFELQAPAVGGGSTYTNEDAQDAVGNILSDSGDVDFTYDDAAPAISGVIKADVNLSGNPTTTTQGTGNNSTRIATTAFVQAAVAALINSAPGTLDTLNEIAAALGNDPNFATTMTAALAAKMVKANNLSDLTNAATARTNLGVAIGSNVQAWSAVLDALALKVSPTGALVGTSDAQTITNKRINPREQTVASSATVTADADANDVVVVTAQAAGLTLANPTGTPVNMQPLMFRIKDNGTARSITFGSQFRAIGVTLPTTTVISKTVYIGCQWNSADTKWDVIGVAQEA